MAPCIELCQRCTPVAACCDGGPFPAVIIATVTATTGGCSDVLGNTTNLTETTPLIWSGTMPCIGQLTIACVDGGCELLRLSIDGCPSADNIQSPVGSCFCSDPFFAVFTFTANPSDLVCGPCCGGFGVGGSFTITLTE